MFNFCEYTNHEQTLSTNNLYPVSYGELYYEKNQFCVLLRLFLTKEFSFKNAKYEIKIRQTLHEFKIKQNIYCKYLLLSDKENVCHEISPRIVPIAVVENQLENRKSQITSGE